MKLGGEGEGGGLGGGRRWGGVGVGWDHFSELVSFDWLVDTFSPWMMSALAFT